MIKSKAQYGYVTITMESDITNMKFTTIVFHKDADRMIEELDDVIMDLKGLAER
jgi:hypothetical protein